MQISDETFAAEVLRWRGRVLVDFWASWCAPCKMMEPMVTRLREDLAGRVKIVALNIDRNPHTAAELGVSAVPAFILFSSGQEVARRSGAQTENQLRSLVEHDCSEAA